MSFFFLQFVQKSQRSGTVRWMPRFKSEPHQDESIRGLRSVRVACPACTKNYTFLTTDKKSKMHVKSACLGLSRAPLSKIGVPTVSIHIYFFLSRSMATEISIHVPPWWPLSYRSCYTLPCISSSNSPSATPALPSFEAQQGSPKNISV